MKKSMQELMGSLSIVDFPVCMICGLTEERARSDIIRCERQCKLVLCKKCYEYNLDRRCQQSTGCKLMVRQHKFGKNYLKQKIRVEIVSRFDKQSKLRAKFKTQKKYAQIDEDMTHILAALYAESDKIYNITYKKQVDKLVQDLEQMKNTVESQIDRGLLPIYIRETDKSGPENLDRGKLACGYSDTDWSKGFNHISRAFY